MERGRAGSGSTLSGLGASSHLGLDSQGLPLHLWLPGRAAARVAVTLEIEDCVQDSWQKRYIQLPKQVVIPTRPALFNASPLQLSLISVVLFVEGEV